jgi:hypothetical protein
MDLHRFTLEPYKGLNTRYRCPSCQHREKTFVRYIDTETGEHIAPSVGRCNRESNCSYHYTPKQYYQDNDTAIPKRLDFDNPKPKAVKLSQNSISFIPIEVFKTSLQGYEANHFTSYLCNLFGSEAAEATISRYFIATSKHWHGATVFWQVDIGGNIRTGKIMLYSPDTGKRVKEPFNHIHWAHKALKRPEFALKQCLFGEHLLKDNSNPVAIVESEKTAVIASVYLPQFIWLAVGSLTNLSAEKCSVLRGRKVTLFPDIKGFDKWSDKANELAHIATFTVSDLLERKANELERQQGLDLADYLIRFSVNDFTISQPIPKQQPPTPKPQLVPCKSEQVFDLDIPVPTRPTWEQDITELEYYFTTTPLPKVGIKLNQCTVIQDINRFVTTHLLTVRANNGNPTFAPYLNRLKELKQVLTINSTYHES